MVSLLCGNLTIWNIKFFKFRFQGADVPTISIVGGTAAAAGELPCMVTSF